MLVKNCKEKVIVGLHSKNMLNVSGFHLVFVTDQAITKST